LKGELDIWANQAYDMQLCLQNRKSQLLKITYDITMLNKTHLLNSCTWQH